MSRTETEDDRLAALLASKTWRWTAPLRRLSDPLLPWWSPQAAPEPVVAGSVRSQIDQVLSSRSWRWTAPLRAVVDLLMPVPPPPAPPPVPKVPPPVVHLPGVPTTNAVSRPLYISTFDAAKTPPSWLNLTMSTSRLCNYRCRHCHIWMQKDSLNGMTTAERVELVRQFAALNREGTVIITGGEVMMDLPELFALAAECKKAELQLVINSNGSYVVDEDIARQVVESGITRLSISLDSHIPEIHRYARGVATAFEDTVRAIRLLVDASRRYNPAFFLSVSCVVFDRNLPHLSGFVGFCRELGVTRADFQLLSRTFANKHPTRDVFWEEHFFHTPAAKAEACAVVGDVIRRNNDGFLLKAESDLAWIADYINQPDQEVFETPEPICGSHERNLMVNPGGEVALCHSNWQVLPDDPYVGNAKTDSIVELWTGPKATAARKVMDQCRLGCGALNCHRR